MTLADRFWPRVDRSGECWEWNGARDKHGYGSIGAGGRDAGNLLAHRASWILSIGPIPDGLFVCHRCDNPPCVRPTHLFLGTQADNLADMHRKGRRQYAVGRDSPLVRLLASEQLDIVLDRSRSERAVALLLGVSHTFVGDIRRGKQEWRVA